MYYRRKVLLGILSVFGGELSHTKLQKVLFLVTRKQNVKSFDFVPYKYGSYSFQANQDLRTLTKKGFLEDRTAENGSDWILHNADDYFSHLKELDRAAIKQTYREIDRFSTRELIRYTYQKYPYFAINSQIVNELLTKKDLARVNTQRKEYSDMAFFTIGYEGISLENYLNKLIINDVRLLCDVRKNPLSMKYGFSKNQLRNACESIGIDYIHIPQLGIDSAKRTNLNTLNDYQRLFDEYSQTTLIDQIDQIKRLHKLNSEYRRIAITCFEKEACMCHRSRVADSLKKSPDWTIVQKNL